MLFNSYGFIFIYLPLVLLGFYPLARVNHQYAAGWLALASVFFYGYWNTAYIGLLLGSIVCNYSFGWWIVKAGVHSDAVGKKWLLIVAISANLVLLTYYKYANFFLGGVNRVVGNHWSLGDIVLPLGISFFTFTQIAFLVDTYQGKVKEYNFIHYVLFVTYFPHLIAGPILHHKEMMPQFAQRNIYKINVKNMAAGLMFFTIGLSKKIILADYLAGYADPVFEIAHGGVVPSLTASWIGALAYTLQLYFDFSGYSDMAIGLSLMFNVRLPLNFHSPYKSVNIIEFWRRWHMTLSRFLRDYLYIPLGGNRKGKSRRYLNLMVTMVLGGLWHGAGWTFIIWGGLHGLYLMINHGWQVFKKNMGWGVGGWLAQGVAVSLTFVAVVVAWVFFRSQGVASAKCMLAGMMGLSGVEGKIESTQILGVSIGFVIVFFLPNTQQLLNFNGLPARAKDMIFWTIARDSRSTAVLGVLFGVLACIATLLLSRSSTFLYFQF